VSVLSALARRALFVPIVGAAYGWQDRLRALPGPRIALVLPLREPSHQAAVPLVSVLAIWIAAFAIAAIAVPARCPPLAAALRGLGAFGAILVVQAVSLQLVREATTGFDWHAALTGPIPFIAGTCAAVATVAATPRRTARAVVAAAGMIQARRLRPLASGPRRTV
jgi:hypothetical protein